MSSVNELLPPTLELRKVLRLIALVVGLCLLYALVPYQGQRAWLGASVGAAALIGVTPFTIGRVRAVQRSEHPLATAAEALLMLSAMVVFGFAMVYLWIDHRSGQFSGLDTRIDALYFTVTTLSTVGFGDIVATGQRARMVVTVQIVLDFTLIAYAFRVLLNVTRNRTARG